MPSQPYVDVPPTLLSIATDPPSTSSPIVAIEQVAETRPFQTSGMVTRSMNNIHKPKHLFMTTKHPMPSSIELTSVHQALKDPHWCQAMSEEFIVLICHGTWKLVPLTSNQNLVGSKWVFHIKRKPNGSIDRYKARLVAKDFHQLYNYLHYLFYYHHERVAS